MRIQSEKAELIGRLHGSRQDAVCRDVIGLLDILLDETRIDNDTAEGITLARNQGKIELCKELKDIISKGLPAI